MAFTCFLINSIRPTHHLKRKLLFLRSIQHSAVMTESPMLIPPASGLCMMFPPVLQAGLFSTQPIEKGPDRPDIPRYEWLSESESGQPAQSSIETIFVT